MNLKLHLKGFHPQISVDHAPKKYTFYTNGLGDRILKVLLNMLSVFNSGFTPVRVQIVDPKSPLQISKTYMTKRTIEKLAENVLIRNFENMHFDINPDTIKRVVDEKCENEINENPEIIDLFGLVNQTEEEIEQLYFSFQHEIMSEFEKIIPEIEFTENQQELDVYFYYDQAAEKVVFGTAPFSDDSVHGKIHMIWNEEENALVASLGSSDPHHPITAKLNSFCSLTTELSKESKIKNLSFIQSFPKSYPEFEFDFFLGNKVSRKNMDNEILSSENLFLNNGNHVFFSDHSHYMVMGNPHYIGAESFWKAIVENKSPIIVCLESAVPYWPSAGETLQLEENLEVTCLRSTEEANSILSEIVVKYQDREQKLLHIAYKGWPDFGIPAMDEVNAINDLIDHAHATDASMQGPITVHCGAGQGRSGTFVAARQIKHNPRVYPVELIKEIRLQRPHKKMVETAEQYEFVCHYRNQFI